jgi:hypothetical protein
VSDFTVAGLRDYTALELGEEDIRNVGECEYSDRDGARSSVTYSDTGSITDYGGIRRYFLLSEPPESPVRTPSDATTLIRAAVQDLRDPDVMATAIQPLHFGLECAVDLLTYPADGIFFTATQNLAPFSLTHSHDEGREHQSSVGVRGTPSGGRAMWKGRSVRYDSPPAVLALKNFRETRVSASEVRYEWEPTNAVVEVWVYEAEAAKPIASEPWPTSSTIPTHQYPRTTTTYTATVPAEGRKKFLQFEPRDDSNPPKAGEVRRATIDALPGTRVQIERIYQSPGGSLSKTDLNCVITDSLGRAGVLYAWVNKASTDDADPTAEADGSISLSGPGTVTSAATWNLTGGGTDALFDEVGVHSARAKRIFLEYVAEDGTTTGQVDWLLKNWLDLIDPDGDLITGAIKFRTQFASTIRPPEVLAALPALPDADYPEGSLVTLVPGDGTVKLYRNEGGSWTAAIPTTDLSGTIAEAQIANAAVTAAKIATGAVEESKIGALAVTAAKIGAGAVETAKLATGAVTEAVVAAGAITEGKIGTSAVTVTKLADGTVTQVKMGSGLRVPEIVSALPAAGTQGRIVLLTTDNKLYRDTGTAWTAAVPTTDLTGTITSTQITDGAISTPKLAANAVTAAKIAAGTITSTEIAADTIVAGNIAAGAIGATEIAADAVVAAKIAAGAVETAKIAANAVTAAKIAANTITASQIAAGTITTTEIASSTIVAGNIASGAITTGLLAAGAVTATKLAIQSHAVDGLTLTSNSPTAGSVAWSAHTISYNGTTYSIGAGSTSAEVIWLDVSASTTALQGSTRSAFETAFSPAAGDLLVATNSSGTADPHFNATYVTGGMIRSGVIVTDKLAASAVTAAKIATGTITASQIATDTIQAYNIAAGAITASELAADSVEAGKIAAGAISTSALFVSGVVESTALATGAVVAGKIAAGAIDAASLIVDGVITAAKISVTDLSAINANFSGTVTSSGTIAAASFTATTAQFSGNAWVDGDIRLTEGGAVNFYTTTGGLTRHGSVSGSSQRLILSPGDNGVLIGELGGGLGHKVGFYGATPVTQRAVGGAATDAATTQTLANNLRQALIDLGLATT